MYFQADYRFPHFRGNYSIENLKGGKYNISSMKFYLNLGKFLAGGINPLTGPVKIQWELTYRCNLRCRHCHLWKIKEEKRLSKDRIFEVLEELRSLGGKYVSFSGGELFLLRESFEILSRAKSLGFRVAANSNGWLLDRKNAEKLAGTGIDTIFLSLDGPKEIHDWIRGVEGAWERVMAAIKNIREAGKRPMVFVNITLNRKNLPYLPQTIEMAIGQGAQGVTIEPVHSIEKYSPEQDLGLRPQDAELLAEKIEEVLERFSKYLPHFHAYLRKFPEFIMNPEKVKRSFRCIAAYFSVQIHPNGDVHPCPVAFRKLGNLEERSFREIWFSPQAEKLRRDIKEGKHPPCMFTCVGPANLYLSYIRKGMFWKFLSPGFIEYVLKEKL